MSPEPLWTPSEDRRSSSPLGRFIASRGFAGYDDAWHWSVDPATAGEFWETVAEEFGVRWRAQPSTPVEPDAGRVPGVRWFPGGQLNYAEHCLFPDGGGVVALSDTRAEQRLSAGDLRRMVAQVRSGLVSAGVSRGDRVAGYLPNIPEALAAMLAAASLGAVWTCCAPEMGVAGCLDRLAQVEPAVLIAVDGYRYGGRTVDRRSEAEAIRAGLTSLRSAVWLPYLQPAGAAPDGWMAWDSFTAQEGPLEFEPVAFDHPLYILYSSGTTGAPKAIVHGHGGILLEHAKALGWHFDIGKGDSFFWFTTTGWMMWNFCVSGLLLGSTVVLFDGEPAGDRLFRLMADERVTCGGVGAGYLVASMKAGLRPGATFDLSALRTLGSTGSPLPAAAAEWVYREVKGDVLLGSFSGGTDVCTGFVGASPLHPVWSGEMSCRLLGAAVEVFDDDGRPVVGTEGELVLTRPLPSMPVGFVGDEDGSRYRATYFERFDARPGGVPVWAHGDRATLTERGTVVISGRSDGTLNRGGVRMGTAEFYAVVEGLDEVADSLVVHLEDPGGGPGQLLLFVVGQEGSEDLIRTAIRRDLSPRHVPDRITLVPAIPRTLSGKKLEVPVKRILSGIPPDRAVTRAAVADPASLDPFIALARS